MHGRCLGAVRALFGCGRSFGAGALGAARAPGVRSGLAKGGLFRYGCGVQYFPTGRQFGAAGAIFRGLVRSPPQQQASGGAQEARGWGGAGGR